MSKFPLEIQEVIDDTGKAVDSQALGFIRAHSTRSHKLSFPQQPAVWLIS